MTRLPGCQPCCRSTLRGSSRDLDLRVFRMWPCSESVVAEGRIGPDCIGIRNSRKQKDPRSPLMAVSTKRPFSLIDHMSQNQPASPVQLTVGSSSHSHQRFMAYTKRLHMACWSSRLSRRRPTSSISSFSIDPSFHGGLPQSARLIAMQDLH